jgi:hypothetical protein
MRVRLGCLLATLLGAGCSSSGGDSDSQGVVQPVAPTELVAVDGFLSNLVVDDDALYFQALSGVRTRPLAGGDHVELAGTTGEAMTQDEDALWLTRGSSGAGQIIRVAKSDGSAETIVADQLAPSSIAVDETHVYWTNESTYQADPPDGSVMMASKDGSELVELAGRLESPRNVAIDASHVYFTTGIEDGAISRVARDGSAPEILVQDQVWPKALIAAAGAIYWFNDAAGSSSQAETSPIMRHDLASGETRVLHEDDVRPHDLALDGEALYWTAQNFGDCNTNPDVRTMPAGGGAVRTLASKLMDANDLVVRADTLYFARSLSGCGAIFALPAR